MSETLDRPNQPRIVAGLVVYRNPEPMLRELIKSFENSAVQCILVVSDNSPDDALRSVFSDKDWIIYIHNKGENNGFGAAHNIALSKAPASEFYLVVNPDISFDSQCLSRILSYMESNPDVVLLNPSIVYPSGERQYLAKRYPTFFALFARRFAPRFAQSIVESYIHKYEMRDMGYDKVFEVPYLSGCFMVFRRDVLEKIQGFDERFFMYLEDADITLRAAKYGRTVFYPGAIVVHHWERGAYKSLKLTWTTIESAWILFRKHGFKFF